MPDTTLICIKLILVHYSGQPIIFDCETKQKVPIVVYNFSSYRSDF